MGEVAAAEHFAQALDGVGVAVKVGKGHGPEFITSAAVDHESQAMSYEQKALSRLSAQGFGPAALMSRD